MNDVYFDISIWYLFVRIIQNAAIILSDSIKWFNNVV